VATTTMIADLLPTLAGLRLLLASTSPRRLELLQRVGVAGAIVVPSGFAEDLPKGGPGGPAAYALETARRKAHSVAAAQLAAGAPPLDVLIAADSIVVDADGAILEQPASAADAAGMLRRLSGRSSSVVTAVVLLVAGSRLHERAAAARGAGGGVAPGGLHELSFVETARVHFAALVELCVDEAEVADAVRAVAALPDGRGKRLMTTFAMVAVGFACSEVVYSVQRLPALSSDKPPSRPNAVGTLQV
jgi:hypothetical protein